MGIGKRRPTDGIHSFEIACNASKVKAWQTVATAQSIHKVYFKMINIVEPKVITKKTHLFVDCWVEYMIWCRKI